MALTLTVLQARLDLLKSARYSGTRSVEFEHGVKIEYKSDAEMAAAVAALEADIRDAEGVRVPRGNVRVSLWNGLY